MRGWLATSRRAIAPLDGPSRVVLERERRRHPGRFLSRAYDRAWTRRAACPVPLVRRRTLNLADNCSTGTPVPVRDSPRSLARRGRTTRRLSYRELQAETSRLAGALKAAGHRARRPGRAISAMLPEAVAALFACAKIGAIALPIFLGFRRGGRRGPACRLRGGRTDHGRRYPPPRHAWWALKEVPTWRSRWRLACAICWWSGGSAATSMDARARPLVARRARRRARRLPERGDGLEDPVPDRLHLGDEPASQGLGPRPRRVLPRSRQEVKPAWICGETTALLGDRPGLDHGSLGDRRRPGPGGDDRSCSRGCRLSRPRPALGARRGVCRSPTLGLSPTFDPRPDAPRRRAGAGATTWGACESLARRANRGIPSVAMVLRARRGGRCPVINISGGTEVGRVSSRCCRSCAEALHAGGPCLGMAADVFDAAGRPLRGAVGELVCTRPWPGMTRGFWNDPERLPSPPTGRAGRTFWTHATGLDR